jgi:two-component system CheB/CheR fusion protein
MRLDATAMSDPTTPSPSKDGDPAEPKENTFPVVGIGASAGGIEALQRFFSNMPADSGMAFVVILHLSPEHESTLPELIQNRTSMSVAQVTEAVKVEPNHVYVIPPNKSLVMSDGSIRLTEPERDRGRHVTIDLFLRTLAEAYGKDAVCIILSGSGADGTLGLKRVKENGGTAVVQDPSDAEYQDMPRSAIDTGLADLILPVAQMPEKLVAFRQRAEKLQLPVEEEKPAPPFTSDALREVLTLLRVRTGHDFTNYKRPTLLRRVARRLQVCGVEDIPSYLTLLREHPAELQSLLRDLLISVTNFFRDPEGFKVLQRLVVPRLFEGKKSGEQVRVWVVGCATGEEAYSLAILLSEHLAHLDDPPQVQVFASDIDNEALAEARAHVYPETIAADVSPERLRHFFIKEGNHYRVKKELREMVLFAYHNILRDPPFSRIDLITCRNLLIYLNRETQDRVLETFHFALRAEGYLFLGSSESAENLPSLYGAVDKKQRIYERRGVAVHPPPLPSVPRVTDWRPQELHRAGPSGEGLPPFGELHHQLVERYAPPSVLVNEEDEIVHLSEHAGRYLRFVGGEPSRNLFKAIHPDLRLDVRAALFSARQQAGAVESRRLRIELDGEPRMVRLRVQRVAPPDAGGGHFLVFFEESSEAESATGPSGNTEAAASPTAPLAEITRQLEGELQTTRNQLRSTIEQYETSTEELRASNEELQAINEELRSATEELETSKEELQSVNEELITVNHELKQKVEEVSRANSDLQNLMGSTDIATIFLDRELRIMRFTPRAQQLFNIIPTDVGRPLQHLTHKLDYADLAAEAQQVLQSLHSKEREVRDDKGRRYIARLLPYRTLEDRIDGIVATFIDVTELKQAEEAQQRLAALVENSSDLIGMTTLEGRTLYLNPAGAELFGLDDPRNIVGKTFTDFLPTTSRRLFTEEVLPAVLATGRWEGEVPFQHLKTHRPINLNQSVFLVREPRTEEPLCIGTLARDITEYKRTEQALKEADRRKDEFLAVLAHELRNPLAPIRNALLLLNRGRSDVATVEQSCSILERQVRQLVRLVDDLLDLSRISQGKIQLKVERVELAEVVQAALETSRPLIDGSRHQLTVALPTSPVYLQVDPARLAQALNNLLNNAAKFTEPGGRISLTAEVTGEPPNPAVIRVRDTGMGIPEEVLPHVFDLFVQGEQGRGRSRGGLGIGLTLVRQLVEMHGGQIEAHSDGPGKGSEFVLRLPLARDQTLPARAVPDRAAPAKPRRILVVDDNRDQADSLAQLLRSMGHEVSTAYNGPEAVQAALADGLEVALVDIGLPGMDGNEVARRIRQQSQGKPPILIALTGWGQEEDLQRSHDAGFDQHLVQVQATFFRFVGCLLGGFVCRRCWCCEQP